MTTDTEFWTRVDALLDARRDPFDDAEVARALLHEPTRLAQLETLLARLEPNALNAVAPAEHTPASTARPTATDPTSSAPNAAPAAPATHARRHAPTTRRAAAALLLLGAAALATWLATRSDSRELTRPDQLVADTQHAEPAQVDAPDAPHVAPARLARVVEFHASVRRERLGRAAPCASLPASTAHTPPRIHSDWRQTWSAP